MKTNQSQTAPAEVRENIMGTMEINPLLLKLSIPMMISMLVQALYNVVDSVFVSHVSENALTAVSLAFSLQNVMIAVGVGTGVGVNALLSKSLGEKNQSRANATAENGIFLSLCSFAVFFVIGLTCMKPYFYAQTSDPVIAQQGIRYLSVCCIFSLGLFTQTMGEKLLAATGRTYLSMISQLVGAVVNIILDPIFIFGYCGEALSGTTGAAVATVIGQFCGAGMTLYFNTRKNPDIQISFKGFRPSAKAIGRIYTVGLPSIAMQCVGSLMTFGMNLILMAFSATAVAVFGVYFKLQSFVFMPIFGLNNGMVPIISYNYGARRPNRVKKDHQAGGVLRRGHHAGRLLHLPVRTPAGVEHLCRQRRHAGYRHPGHAHHLPAFPAGGRQHRAQLGLSGAGQRRFQSDRFGLPPAVRAAAGSVAAGTDRQRQQCLVGLPHCGSRQHPDEHGLLCPYQQDHHRTPVPLTRVRAAALQTKGT